MTKNTLRIITPLPADLVTAVDDYRFGQRLASRAAAIRTLLAMGLEAAAPPKELESTPDHCPSTGGRK